MRESTYTRVICMWYDVRLLPGPVPLPVPRLIGLSFEDHSLTAIAAQGMEFLQLRILDRISIVNGHCKSVEQVAFLDAFSFSVMIYAFGRCLSRTHVFLGILGSVVGFVNSRR